MKCVKPLRDISDELALEISVILHYEPWNTTLVQKALYCYRAWVDYSVRKEEVKTEILFP
jgi:hypothetical protein